MKCYLLYPDCYAEESINRCRFALLKFLSLYNLQAPANISVIIHTNKAALFEIFQPFFKELQFVEKAPTKQWQDLQGLQQLLSGYQGNALVCQTNGYPIKPVEEIFAKIDSGALLYCSRQEAPPDEQPGNTFFKHLFAAGVSTAALCQPSPSALYTGALNCATYFTQYKIRKEVGTLLKTFFQRNEEESITNLVKKVRNIDIEAIEEEAAATDKLPFYKKWLLLLRGKNTILRKQLNKL